MTHSSINVAQAQVQVSVGTKCDLFTAYTVMCNSNTLLPIRAVPNMGFLLLKSLMCMIRITQRQAPHVSMEAMQSTSRPAADETGFLIPISWHAIYTAVGLLQPGVRC